LSSSREHDWTRFVTEHPSATLYHTLPWRDFLVAVFGHRPTYLIASSGGSVVGVLPLFHVAVPMIGSKLLSIPYDIGSGGALAHDEEAERALVNQAMTIARDRRVDYLELRHGGERPALQPLGLRVDRPVLISDMPLDDAASVQSRIASDHRKAIRKA